MTKASLLLIDDDRHVRESMGDWLRDQGYKVDSAGDRASALAALSRKVPDVVLCDVRLPDGDGFDVLAHCREHTPAASVILVSGYGTVEMAMDAMRSAPSISSPSH